MMLRHKHTLVIGGTGMLADASVQLATACSTITLVGRTRRSLERVAARLPTSVQGTHLLSLDWSKRTEFVDALRKHVLQVGLPTLTVAWLHDDDLGPLIAQAVCSSGEPSTFVQVVGSRALHSSAGGVAWSPPQVSGVHYQMVILGFVRDGATARWLTHEEVCTGVLSAIASRSDVSAVGTVESWSKRS